MERPLDNFIKDKLSQQRFPLDDDAWESMETILDNKEVPSLSSKPKPFKLYKLAGLLCILVLCYTIYVFSMKQRKAKQISENKIEAIAESATKQETFTKEADIVEDGQFQDENGAEGIEEYSVNSAENKSQEIKHLEDRKGQEYVGSQDQAKEFVASSITDNSIQATQQSNNISQSTLPAKEIIIAQSNTSRNTNANSNPNNNTMQINTANNVAESAVGNRRFELPSIHALQAGVTQYLVYNQRFSGMPHMTKIKQKTQIVTEKRRPLFGAYLASQNFDTDRSYIAGVHGQFFLNRRLSISVEPGYSYRALEAASVAKDSSEFVSFGANTYEQDIVGQSVHSLHVPAFVHYHLTNAFKIGAGVSYNRVLTLGAIKETRIDGVVTEEKEIWLDKEFYTNNFYRTQLYVGYMLNQHASLDVQYELPLQQTNLFNEETSIGLRLKLYL